MTEQQKDEFERNQSDMGLANYGKEFVYEKYADRIGHFKRIKERSAFLLACRVVSCRVVRCVVWY
jgi:hypothetical protein